MTVVAFPSGRMGAREPWVSRRELAAHLGVSTRTVTNYVRAGMPSLKLRGERRFKISETEAWLRAKGWAA